MAKIEPRGLKIESIIESKEVVQEFRPYLGASAMGAECSRAIWYGFRCYKKKKIDARLNRLFSRGHREEPIVIADLEAAGVKVTGTQAGAKFARGHGGGHCDGMLEKLPDAPKTKHLLEIKTSNDKRFGILKRQKVRASNFGYYIQMQIYMNLFKLKRSLFISANKNDDSRYYERIKYNHKEATEYMARGEDIIFSPFPPRKISENPEFFRCRWCDFSGICHHNEVPLKNCRTCTHSKPINKGKWKCKKKDKILSFKKQLKGCKQWSRI